MIRSSQKGTRKMSPIVTQRGNLQLVTKGTTSQMLKTPTRKQITKMRKQQQQQQLQPQCQMSQMSQTLLKQPLRSRPKTAIIVAISARKKTAAIPKMKGIGQIRLRFVFVCSFDTRFVTLS